MKLFVDSNIILYLLTKDKNYEEICRVFNNREIELHTSAIVLNEVKYKLLWIEASQRINSNNKFEILKEIKSNKDLRKSVYARYLKFLRMAIERFRIHPVSSDEEILSCGISAQYGLLPSDSTIVATMMNNQIKQIYTSDSDFKSVPFIKVRD